MSLSKPGSHCPKCGRPIRWYHNLPIVGWLLLRGKCRDCNAAISVRYPLVELAVALLVVATAYFDVYRPTVEAALDPEPTMDSAPPELQIGLRLLAMFAHAWTGCVAIAVLLIAWDGERVPWRLAITAIAVALFAAPFLESAAIWPLAAASGFAVCIAFLRNRTIGNTR